MSQFIWPVSGPITSPFGQRASGFHNGLDIGAPDKSNVVASAAGKVISVGLIGLGGNTVIIDHGDGYTSMYCHLSSFATSTGAQVAQGQMIGKSGGTIGEIGAGNSTGPHLHFEIRFHGNPVDPQPLLTGVAPTYMSKASAADIAAANTPQKKASLYDKILGPGRFILDTINGTIDQDIAALVGIGKGAKSVVSGTLTTAQVIGKVGGFVTDKNNWKRIGLGLIGTVILLIATLELLSNDGAVKTIAGLKGAE